MDSESQPKAPDKPTPETPAASEAGASAPSAGGPNEPQATATDASSSSDAASPSSGGGRSGQRSRGNDRGGRQGGGRRGGGGQDRGGRAGGGKKRRRRPTPGLDSGPPRFDPAELAELTGIPLYQSVHAASVAEITDQAVFVEVKPHSHEPLRAMVDPLEFGTTPPEVGTELKVRLLDPADPVPAASVKQARSLEALDAISHAQQNKEPVAGVILAEVKGGYAVAVGTDDVTAAEAGAGVRGFLPKSHGEHPRLHELNSPVGEVDKFDITEIEPERANIVLSRKKSLRVRYDAAIKHIWEGIKEGDTVTGRVRALVPYGAFVDLGGVDALLHASDLSWDRQPRVNQVLKVGQKIDAQVIVVDQPKGKIKIGLKQLAVNPWNEVQREVKAGSEVEGDVVALTDYGVFVRLREGIEGLIHLSEVSWDRIKHVSQRFHIGDKIKARVLDVDMDKQRISLSTKALEPNPFQQVADQFPTGTVVRAKVKSLTDFGAFVALDNRVDGLIHIGEMSWTEHVTHPSQVVTLGEEIEVVVLDVDVSRQRVACSIKQLSDNPWQRWEKKFSRGTRHTLKVTRVVDQGAYFDTGEELTGFCPNRDISTDPVSRASEAVRVGDEVEMEVRSLDRRRRQVVLSAKAVFEGDTRAAYDEYKRKEAQTGAGRTTLGDALGAKLGSVAPTDAEGHD